MNLTLTLLAPCACVRLTVFRRGLARLCEKSLVTLSVLLFNIEVNATDRAEPLYNLQFLQGNDSVIDNDETLHAFLNGDSVPVGEYSVDLYVNRNRVARQTVSFERNPNSGTVEPCTPLSLLENLGLNPARLDREVLSGIEASKCPDLKTLIAHYDVQYNANRQELHISLPQAYMSKSVEGYVDPQLWDEGVTAGFVDYSLTGRRSTTYETSSHSTSALLRSGINLGAWRLRNESSFSESNQQSARVQNNRNYAQRDITSLKSLLTVGSSYTSSQIFDSVRFKGIQLASDESMLPESMRGYAPVIRGIAQSNATVEIRQNGFLIYNENVSPGAFEISDVYPGGSNGDLEVTVIEADGHKTVSTQSFSSLPQMLRRGVHRYSLAAGQYDDAQNQEEPKLALAGLTYGLTDNTTVFGGVLGASGYHAENFGATQNTPFGAFSSSLTHSSSTSESGVKTGQSVQFNYAKTINATDTTFSLAGYRFSSEGYRSLTEHVTDQRQVDGNKTLGRTRTRLDLTINQTLGNRRHGTIYVGGEERNYWNLPGKSQQYKAGYANAWGTLNYSIDMTYAKNQQNASTPNTSQLLLTLSMPLGKVSSAVRVDSSLNLQNSGDYSVSTGINGPLPVALNAHYNARLTQGSSGNTSATVGLNTQTPVARLDAGYTQGRSTYSGNVGAHGSIVAHAGGINLGQSVGDTFTLAHVPGARPGTRLGNYSSATVGQNGYAVVPSTRPYRHNWISLNTEDLGSDLEIENPMQQVIPRRGSITLATFNTVTGRRVQMELLNPDGTPLPFGASVEDESGRQLAVVDPGGYALIMAGQNTGTVDVKFSGGACRGSYELSPKDSALGYDQISVVCK